MSFQRYITKNSCLSIILISIFFYSCKKEESNPVQPPEPQTINEKVEALLSQMTLEEKVGQMTQAERGALGSDDNIKIFYLGSLLSGGGSSPDDNSPFGWADMYDHYQSIALKTRLKIPLIFGIDAVHGHHNVNGAVIFPHHIALGATRNAELVEKAYRILGVVAKPPGSFIRPCAAPSILSAVSLLPLF
mgnify:CR=1 FL=1